MYKKLKLGFSLIELSIVILVIGILVIGITQGSRIMREAKLKSARALTSSSPVNSISNVVFWVDSVSEKSFDANVADGSAIATWYDLNPQANIPNNAIGSGLPTYTNNAVNGLPVVRFEDDDGSNDFLTFDGSAMVGSN
jgi:prepilin-type N-terminal cleavage/methylation domain-containing protein